MKAISVPVSTLLANGVRMDLAPYMDAAFETPETLKPKIKKAARTAYFKQARRGLARVRNLRKWNAEHLMDDIKVVGCS